MNTLDTDTLVVIEPPAQPIIENVDIADTEEPAQLIEALNSADSADNTAVETAMPESEHIQGQATIAIETDQAETVKKVEPAIIDKVQPSEVEQTAVELTKEQQPILDAASLETAQPKQQLVAKDETALPTESQSTDTSTIQTFDDVSATESSFSAFGAEWLVLAVVLITSVTLLIGLRKTAKRVEQACETKTVHQHISDVDIEFEKAKIVAENRQKWIHSLREEIANFVAATNAIWDLHKIKDGCENILTEMKDPQFVMKELYHWSCTYNQAMQETEKLYAKIHLLINPQEEVCQHLSSLLDKAMVAVEAKKSPSKLNDEIIAASQRILKGEWERVKQFR